MLIRGARALGTVFMSLALLSACGASSGVTVDCQGVRVGRPSLEGLLVQYDGRGRVDPLFLVVQCKSSDEVQIRDPQGKTYHDFDDFLAHNDVLTKHDRISAPRRIPSLGKDVGSVDLPGHTSGSSQIVWWLIGGAVPLAGVVAVGIWRSPRWRARYRPDE